MESPVCYGLFMKLRCIYVSLCLLAFVMLACGTTSKVADTKATAEPQPAEVVVADEAPSVETPVAESGTSAAVEVEAGDETIDENAKQGDAAETEASASENDQADGMADIGDLIRCEVSIDYEGHEHVSESVGPTIEEARDNAIDEVCAVPCAEKLPETAQDNEREDLLDACIEMCAVKAKAIAAQCWQHGESIYTEGAWSPTNDAPPTNGAEND